MHVDENEELENQEPGTQQEPGTEGFPEDGEELGKKPEPKEPSPDDEVTLTRAELTAFQEQQQEIMKMLKGLNTPQQPGNQPPPQQESQQMVGNMTKEEFERTFWDNPTAALEIYKKEIAEELKREQTKVSGQQQFWNTFYAQNKDLVEDGDLVQLTLNQNMQTLADMPVAEAAKKLADLTRQRILRYAGGENTGGQRKSKPPHTEGTEHRIPRQQKQEPEAPMSLGELIRARKAARQNSGKAVAT